MSSPNAVIGNPRILCPHPIDDLTVHPEPSRRMSTSKPQCKLPEGLGYLNKKKENKRYEVDDEGIHQDNSKNRGEK